MVQYEITNATSGLSVGVFEAPNADAALEAMARAAGYADYREACCAVAHLSKGELQVTLHSTSPAEDIRAAVNGYLTAETDADKALNFEALCEALDASYEEEGHSRDEIDGMDLEALSHDMIRRAREYNHG